MRLKKIMAVIILFLIANVSVADEESLSVKVNRLTLDTVVKIANGAIDACRAKGIPVSVTRRTKRHCTGSTTRYDGTASILPNQF